MHELKRNEIMLRKLVMIANSNKGSILQPGEHPPCFESLNQYTQWSKANDPTLAAAVPPRKDWPAEPNYCRDCSPGHRNKMRLAGRCLFPSTVFIEVGSGQDAETVGT